MKTSKLVTLLVLGAFMLCTSTAVYAATKQEATQQSTTKQSSQQPDLFSNVEQWDPLANLQRAQDYMNAVFDKTLRTPRTGVTMPRSKSGMFAPDIDMKEGTKDYVLQMDLPGMAKDQLTIEVKNGVLFVSGTRSTESEEKKSGTEQQGYTYYQRERSFGAFERSVPLPDDARDDAINAKYENGVLTVTIQKKETAIAKQKTTTIPIQ